MLGGQVVADVVEVDFAVFLRVGVFDEEGNGDGRTGALAENIVLFLAAKFAGGAGVAAQVEDPDGREFVGEALAEAVGGIGIEEAAVGDEADDAGFADAVGGPADGTDVGVVERPYHRYSRTRCIGLANAPIQSRVFDILVVVVGGFLAGGIRRVADDDANIELLLAFAAVGVAGEEGGDEVFLFEAEGVGEADAGEGRVAGGRIRFLGEGVVDGLDVDGGDVVGEEDDLVRVDFGAVFRREAVGRDEAGLEETRDEGAGAGEGVEDMDAVVGQGSAELLLQQVVDGVDDKIDDFDRGVNDAEALGHLREGVAEEFVVEFDDNLLFAGGVVDAVGAHAHGGVELFEGVGFLFEAMFVEEVEHALHGERDGIVGGEGVVAEEGVEDGLGDEVLGEHLDHLGVGDGVVEVVAEFVGEGVEGGDFAGVGRVADDGGDARDVGLRDLGDVGGPLVPVGAVAALLDDLHIERAFDFADIEDDLGLLGGVGAGFLFDGLANAEGVAAGFLGFAGGEGGGLFLQLVGDGDDLHLAGVAADEVEFVDEGVEAVVVRAEGLEDFPDDAVGVAFVEGVGGVGVLGDDDGDDDIPAFFARGVAHDAADGLDDIDLRIAGREEEDGIECRDIHALGKAADITEDAAGVGGGVGFQPGEFGLLLGGVHAAVHMRGLAGEGAGGCFGVGVFGGAVGLDDGGEHAGDFLGGDLMGFAVLGALDDLAEGDGAAHGGVLAVEAAGLALFGEGFPAADDAGGVIDLQGVVAVGEEGLEAVRDVFRVHGEDEDLVIAEEAEGDGFGEGDDMELFAVERRVVHGAEGGVFLLGDGLGGVRVDARGGRHVEAFGGANEGGVVDFDEGGFVLVVEGGAGGAVGFVADDEVEVGQAVLFLRGADDLDGVVGGEDDGEVGGVVAFAHLVREVAGVGGGRVAQLVGEGLDGVVVGLFALFADLGVGADGEAVERDGGFLRPLGQRLGKEGEAGDEEEDAPALAGDVFGDLEGGEGLAGAASHDEFATVGLGETGEDIGDGLGLVRAKGFPGLQLDGLRRPVTRPVDAAVFEVVQVDARDGRLLADEGLRGVVGPVERRGDDDAVREGLLAGGGEEAVDVLFADLVIGVVELALDGVELVGVAGLGDEVDAGVLGDEVLGFRPIGVGPNIRVKVGIGRLVAEVGADKVFEIGAFFSLGEGGGTEVGENIGEGGHGGEAGYESPKGKVNGPAVEFTLCE